jgi:penicillin-binding protein 1C
VAAFVATLAAVAVWARWGPIPEWLLDAQALRPSVIVTDRHGERLHEARTDLGTRGESISPDRLPPMVVAATLAAEDHRFRSHPGVDPIAIGRATWRNARAWGVEEGGSTITQQVVSLAEARRSDAAPARGRITLAGKAWEAILALRLERRLSKDDILARYLSWAPYGNQVEGIVRASSYYFGVRPEDLTPAQAAYLAALPQQPGRFNPRRDPQRARGRQHRILRRMYDEGWLSDSALQSALAETTVVSASEADVIAPHWVRRALASAGESPGAELKTTLDAGLQRTVLGILAAQAPALERHHAQQAAVVVLDIANDEWLAWVTTGSDIDAAMTPRQPGSALKPFTYAAAFERGWHPGRVLADVPSSFPTAEPGILYSPQNYDAQFRGPLRARLALAGSENVPAVALASEIGVAAVADTLRRAGITTLAQTASHYGLGLTLGNAEVRLDELVRAYAGFAGHRPQFSPLTTYWIADILADPEARRYVFGEGSALDFPFPVAAKTGTSQAYHDNWTIGFTADVAVGVWVGNLDREPLRYSSGVTGAGPIFHDVMLAAVEHVRGSLPLFDTTPIVVRPSALHDTEICGISGMKAGDACPVRTREWLPTSLIPHTCTWHHASDRGVVTVYPEEYRDWLGSVGMREWGNGEMGKWGNEGMGKWGNQTAVGRGLEARRSEVPKFSMTSPPSGTTFLIDPTLRAEFQTVPLKVTGASGRIEWQVNGKVFGHALADQALTWPLARGRHVFTAIDGSGRRVTAEVLVK